MNDKPCIQCGYPLEPAETGPCSHCGGEVRAISSRAVIKAKRGFFVTDFIQGFMSPFSAGLLLMTRKEFMHKLKWPVLVNLLVIVSIAGLGFWGLFTLFGSWLGTDWGWMEWLRAWVGGTLAFILTVVTLFLLAPTIIETVTSPFLDPIAKTTETIITGTEQAAIERGFAKDVMFGLRNAAKILAIQLLILIPALLLSFIPLLFFLPLIAAAYLNALIWFEIPVMRRGYEMSYRRWIVRRNWARALGLGFGFQAGLFVPFFNILFLTPATAVAVSQLYFRFDKVPVNKVPEKLPGGPAAG